MKPIVLTVFAAMLLCVSLCTDAWAQATAQISGLLPARSKRRRIAGRGDQSHTDGNWNHSRNHHE